MGKLLELPQVRVDWPTFAGAVFFLLIGGGFAGFGGYQLVTTYQFMGAAYQVEATVTDNPESCDSDGECTWWPRVEYVDQRGDVVQSKTRFGASNYGWSEGSKITVWVNPDYPYVRVTGGDNLWLMGGAFFALGMLPVVIAIWLLWTMTFMLERGGKDAG